MTNKEIIAVVTHFENGGKVQSALHYGDGIRHDCETPAWNFDEFDYFPKPEPLTLWGVVHQDGSGVIRPTKEAAYNYAERTRTTPMAKATIIKIQAPK